MKKLAYLREDAAMEIQDFFGRFEPSDDREGMIKSVKQLCHNFHMIGTAALFVDGNPEKLFLNACRAGENWRRLLVFCGRKGWALPESSYLAPLLGAVFSGHWELAASIAELSETTWHKEDEYEDEYCLAAIFQAFARTEPDMDHLRDGLLPRLKKTGQGETAMYATLFEHLLDLDEIEFLKAFKDAVQDREACIEKRAASFTTPVVSFSVKRHLWFEGLALLKLGEREGFHNSGGFLYCPPLARNPMTTEYPNDWVIDLEHEPA